MGGAYGWLVTLQGDDQHDRRAIARRKRVLSFDIIGLFAATGALNIRFDLVTAESSSRRRGGEAAAEVVVEIEGKADGLAKHSRSTLEFKHGQASLTGLSAVLSSSAVLGLNGRSPAHAWALPAQNCSRSPSGSWINSGTLEPLSPATSLFDQSAPRPHLAMTQSRCTVSPMKAFLLALIALSGTAFAQQTANVYEDALQAYKSGQFSTAKKLFLLVPREDPKSASAKVYLQAIALKQEGGGSADLETSLKMSPARESPASPTLPRRTP